MVVCWAARSFLPLLLHLGITVELLSLPLLALGPAAALAAAPAFATVAGLFLLAGLLLVAAWDWQGPLDQLQWWKVAAVAVCSVSVAAAGLAVLHTWPGCQESWALILP